MCRPSLNKTIFVLVFLVLVRTSVSQVKDYCSLGQDIVKTVQKYHYSPSSVDSVFGQYFMEYVFSKLDRRRMLFSSEVIERLRVEGTGIDKYILKCDGAFLFKLEKEYRDASQNAIQILTLLQDQELKPAYDDPYPIIKKDFSSESQLTQNWIRWIQFQLASFDLDTIDLKTTKKRLISNEICILQSSTEEDLSSLVGEVYLQSIANAFDPHTSYFNPDQKKEFQSSLADQTLSFGFNLEKNELGDIEVSYLHPGGPAWDSNRINEGDVLISFESAEQHLDQLHCIDSDRISQLLNGHTHAEFTFRKKNGDIVSVKLTKEKIEVEKNAIQSFIIGEKHKIGYIYLPSFYTNTNSEFPIPNGCANDIAKELIMLKREGIEGLVLDLRNNGGGFMLEALRMAGLFIDSGTLSITDDRNSEPSSIKDFNRGVVFDKPLVVLVNSLSASASELFAATIQDYNRGVIAGSSTFGKSTIQQIIPATAHNFSKATNNGFVKVTSGAFYRVNGSTHQKSGVIPDVSIPDLIDFLSLGETEFPNVLELKPINKKTYYNQLSMLPIDELVKRSNERIKNDPTYAHLLRFLELAKHNNGKVSPNQLELIRLSDSKIIQLNVEYPKHSEFLQKLKLSDQDSPGSGIKSVSQNPAIKEAYSIITDLLSIKNYEK